LVKRVLVLAGGGGHTGYAYALAQALHGKAELAFLVPKGDSLSARRLEGFGEVDYVTKSREPKTPLHVFIPRLFKAFIQSFRKVTRRFDVVVSTGSSLCVPPALVAWMKGIPIVNIESSVRFVTTSKTARILQPLAAITALQWEEQRKFLKKGVVVGPIIPEPEVKPWNGGYILVTGGTYGHKQLFDMLAESTLGNVVLQTGPVDPRPYVRKHPEWKVFTVTEQFHEMLAGAALVICHVGETLFEAVKYGKPIIIVPNPEWTRTATVEDAKCLAEKINALVVEDITLRNLLEAMGKAREPPGLLDGAGTLTQLILTLNRL